MSKNIEKMLKTHISTLISMNLQLIIRGSSVEDPALLPTIEHNSKMIVYLTEELDKINNPSRIEKVQLN